MGVKPRTGSKTKWKVENLHRLFWLKQGLSQRQFPTSSNWPARGFDSRTWITIFYGCLFWLQPNTHAFARPRTYQLRNWSGTLLLQSHAIWSKERRSDIPTLGQPDVRQPDWEDHVGLCGWHASKISILHRSRQGFRFDVLHPSGIWNEAQSIKVSLRCHFWKVPRVHR